MPGVVTISASYGARGDKIGRLLAEKLELPFFDRAIPGTVAHQLAQPAELAESLDERTPSLFERIAATFADTALPIGPSQVPLERLEPPGRIRAASEAKLREVADTTGGVVLGRGGMVVLGNRPDVLCVRLDGPVDARIAQVVALGVDEATAQQAQREIDRARNSFARVFFNVNQDDPRLYHVILDSTVLSVEACLDIITRAARDRFGDATS